MVLWSSGDYVPVIHCKGGGGGGGHISMMEGYIEITVSVWFVCPCGRILCRQYALNCADLM